MMIRKGLQPTLKENSAERIIFHLDLDAFFAQVEEVADPTLRGKPVFVVGHSMTSGVVLTANYGARKYGVKTGMSLREAKTLCPFARLVPADCAKYSDTSERIFAHLATYTPLVEIFSIDEAFLDVTDTIHFWGTVEEIAREIKAWVWENFHLTLSIGIAPNKLLAKFASDRNKPNGLFRIRLSEIGEILKTLPVEELCGIGTRLKAHLNQMGIFTAHDLGECPENALFERFGIPGLVLKRMGQGMDHSPVLPVDFSDDAKSMGHSYTLPRPIRDREQAFRYLFWLSEKVGRRLRRRHYEGRIVHMTVRFSDFDTISRQHNFSFYMNEGKQIFQAARRIFSQIDNPRKPIRLLGVSVSNLKSSAQERWLFEALEQRHRLTQVLDAINDKYGEFTLRPAFLAFPDDEKIASRALQLFGSGRH